MRLKLPKASLEARRLSTVNQTSHSIICTTVAVITILVGALIYSLAKVAAGFLSGQDQASKWSLELSVVPEP
jgi:threonine/homoserine/homoserine lactone efflux protein